MTGVILFEKYNLPKYFLNVSTGKEFVYAVVQKCFSKKIVKKINMLKINSWDL